MVHKQKFDYSFFVYKNNYTKGLIICPKHGDFRQSPTHHLSGRNCAKCSKSISDPEMRWLQENNIPDDKEHRQVFLWMSKNKKYKVDGYDSENKIVYEFLGDYWHRKPKSF